MLNLEVKCFFLCIKVYRGILEVKVAKSINTCSAVMQCSCPTRAAQVGLHACRFLDKNVKGEGCEYLTFVRAESVQHNESLKQQRQVKKKLKFDGIKRFHLLQFNLLGVIVTGAEVSFVKQVKTQIQGQMTSNREKKLKLDLFCTLKKYANPLFFYHVFVFIVFPGHRSFRSLAGNSSVTEQ